MNGKAKTVLCDSCKKPFEQKSVMIICETFYFWQSQDQEYVYTSKVREFSDKRFCKDCWDKLNEKM